MSNFLFYEVTFFLLLSNLTVHVAIVMLLLVYMPSVSEISLYELHSMAWMYCMFLLGRRWEIVMMSTIADEGTNSDGREVTTTAQESEKTDAGMIGTTGKEKKNFEETAFICSCATLFLFFSSSSTHYP